MRPSSKSVGKDKSNGLPPGPTPDAAVAGELVNALAPDELHDLLQALQAMRVGDERQPRQQRVAPPDPAVAERA